MFEKIEPFAPVILFCPTCQKETDHKQVFTASNFQEFDEHQTFDLEGKATCFNCGSTKSWVTR